MKVIIKKRHCGSRTFDLWKDDALAVAVKEQVKEIRIVAVYDGYAVDANGIKYAFDHSDKGYSREGFRHLLNGDVKEIEIDLVQEKS
jgi:hypothetical protein